MDGNEERVRILHLITELGVGGAQKVLAQLLPRLNRERFAPTVACLYGGEGEVGGAIRAMGVSTVDLEMTARWRVDAGWRLYRLLRSERPAILHTWLFHANVMGRLIGRLAGVPIVLSGERTMGMENAWRYRVNRFTDGLADRVVCVSEEVARFCVEEVGTPRDKVTVIPNGVDVKRYADLPDVAEARSQLGMPQEKPLVGTVARLEPAKRMDVLLQTMALVPTASAVIVGDGRQRSALETLAEQLKLADRVWFVGHREDVRCWLAALDLFVLCSDREGMPNAVLEAMAAGLPVAATAVGGVPEVVVDGVTGVLVPPGEPATLAEAVAGLLGDKELRRRMGEAGQRRIEECFSVERTVERTEALYEELLAEKALTGRSQLIVSSRC